ncbi:MAG: hypothetical protein GXY58_18730 [Planctomycetaceae bacterium]|nr:hypothetical protein [Planctomycetaceae bacterium]
MVCRIIAVCCLTWLLPAAVWAQAAAKSPEQLTKDVQDLQQKLTTATENLTRLATQVARNTEATTQNAQGIERLTTLLNDELHKQQDLLNRIDELTQLQQDQLARQQAILDVLTRKDAAGNDMLRLSANMETSEEFREDVRKIVHQSLQTEGDFSIHNRMTSSQRIVVNQKEYDLNPDEILTLKVPVGTVTARLPGQPPTNWTLTAPQYSQKIEIVPETEIATTTAYRPVSSDAVSSDAVTPWQTLAPWPDPPTYLTLPPVYVGPVVEYRRWPF